jgi:hypothetical protein
LRPTSDSHRGIGTELLDDTGKHFAFAVVEDKLRLGLNVISDRLIPSG